MAEAETGKYTKRNVLGGLITACVGGLFLGISAYDLVEWSAITNDIGVEPCQGCEPLDKVAMDSAIRSGIFGAILTSVGLFFFIYGMKQQSPK